MLHQSQKTDSVSIQSIELRKQIKLSLPKREVSLSTLWRRIFSNIYSIYEDDLQLGKLMENCLLLKLYRKLRKMFLSLSWTCVAFTSGVLASVQLGRPTEIWRPGNVRPKWRHISRGCMSPRTFFKFGSRKWAFPTFWGHFWAKSKGLKSHLAIHILTQIYFLCHTSLLDSGWDRRCSITFTLTALTATLDAAVQEVTGS